MAVYGLQPQASPPRVRFDAIVEGGNFLFARFGLWLAAVFLFHLALSVTAGIGLFPIISVAVAAAASGRSAAGAQINNMIMGSMGVFLVCMFLASLLGIFLHGGLVRVAIKQVRSEPVSVGDMFSTMDVFLPLLGFALLLSAIITVAVFIVAIIVALMGGPIVDIVYGLVLLGGTYLVGVTLCGVPLIVDKRTGVFGAFQQSIDALAPHSLMIFLFTLTLGIIACIGGAMFWIGTFLTMPVVYLAQAILYNDFFPTTPYTPAPTLDIPLPPPSAYEPERY